MDGPVIHHSTYLLSFDLVRLRPLITVQLAVPLASWTFFAGVVSVGLYPAGGAGAAINPAGKRLREQEWCAEVVVWVADLGSFNDSRWRRRDFSDGFGAAFRFADDGEVNIVKGFIFREAGELAV